MNRRLFLTALLGCLLFLVMTYPASAQYPEKKIRFVVPWDPGGQADMTARTLARCANAYLNGRIYVENVPGAAGAIGWRECSRSVPDGYALALLTAAMVTAPYVIKDYPGYNRFDPICLVNVDSRIVVTQWEGRFKTAGDFISYAKLHPGEISVATAGVGTVNHIGMAAFGENIGTRFTFVPYKGDGPAVTAVMGGHVEIVAAGNPTVRQLIEAKKLRPLVILGERQYDYYPGVPTSKQLGYDVVVVAFMGVGVPKGIPEKVKLTLSEAFRKAVDSEDYKKFLDRMGLDWVFLGPDQTFKWLKGQDDFYRAYVPKLGLKPE